MTRAERAAIAGHLARRYNGAERVTISRDGEIHATVGRMPNTTEPGRIYVGSTRDVLRDMEPMPTPPSRAADRRILIYFADPATREQLDALAKADGLTRSQMIAQLVEREAARRARKSN